ncbi:unnamed protein product [Didymodactylos carnosus]|uniref:Uncharacterized protein n=1 Tax=Didymodactylos carnosus TaxID=1234261 RepID=A0A8S2W9T2_9BILA|nr:unnamed protein product [Didymodactylos carnosus]
MFDTMLPWAARMYFTNKKTGEQYPLGGFRPSSKPSTAKKFSSIPKFGSAEIPKKVDLREMMTPVKSQGTLQSCSKHVDISRLFIYYNARVKDGTSYDDVGTTIVSAVEALEQFGCCTDKTWPYDPSMVTEEPSKQAYEEAKRYRVSERRCPSIHTYTP